MPKRPTVEVTVAIMSYNNSDFVGETIESVLSQTGASFELIVYDDCSTDASLPILERYVSDERYTFQQNSVNLGMMGNYNRCVDSGTGKYVVVLGSDDVMYPGHLASLYSALELHPESALAYVQCNWIDERGGLIRFAGHPGHKSHSYFGHRNEMAGLLSYDNYITPSAVMLRRSALDVIRRPDGVIHDPWLMAGDWELWIRIARSFPDFVFLRQATIGYRIHGGQVSKSFYGSDRPLAEHTTILERVLADEKGRNQIRQDAPSVWKLYQQRYDAYPQEIQDNYRLHRDEIHRALFSADGSAAAGYFFSVVLTTYNRPDLLTDALNSLNLQRYTDFEVVLVNDGGEPVEHLLSGYAFPITYVRQGRNRGLSAARNAGLKLARGRYVTYLDDDDVYLPDHLAQLAAAFEQHPESVVYTDVVYVQERLEGGERIELGRSFPTAHEAFDRDKLFVHNYIPVNTWAHLTSAVDKVGDFDTGLTAFEDWDMLLRLVQHYPVHRVARTTAEVHQRGADGADHMLAREHSNLLGLYKKIYARYPEMDNHRIQSARRDLLAGRPPVLPGKAWGALDWIADRAPCSGRVAALVDVLRASPDVGTVGVAIIAELDTALPTLGELLRCLQRGQRVAPSCIWLIAPAELGGGADWAGVEWITGAESWQTKLARRVLQPDSPDFLWMLHPGDRPLPHALLTITEYRLRMPDPLILYSDDAVLAGDQVIDLMLKPDFDSDMLCAYPYVGRNLVFSTAALKAVGGLDDRFGDLSLVDFLWRLVESVGPKVVGHVPEILHYGETVLMDWAQSEAVLGVSSLLTQLHIARLGSSARVHPGVVAGLSRVDYPLIAQTMVSVIIQAEVAADTRALEACLGGLVEHCTYPNYEVLVVCDGTGAALPESGVLLGQERLPADRVRVLSTELAGPAARLNFAAEQARGEVFLFLSAAVRFTAQTRPDWLQRLLVQVQRPEVGVAGSRLDSLSSKVDQAGLVLGLGDSVWPACRGVPSHEWGNMSRLIVQHQVSAVGAACLMVRRVVFSELGGFDANAFPGRYFDADLDMKATRAGYLLVLEPDTGLMCADGADDQTAAEPVLEGRADVELDPLYERWLPQLARDPNYHPAFTREPLGAFMLGRDVSRIHEPLPGRPLPVVVASHSDWQGCGYYRVMHPLDAMANASRLDGSLTFGGLRVTDAARVAPDVIVLQGGWAQPGILEKIRRYRRFLGAKIVLEFDDYLPNIPTRSVYRKMGFQGRIKDMRRAVEEVDWLVVSTPTLAQEYANYHSDIRVALNGLPGRWWGGLKSQRQVGRKMRVGWAGGSGHAGDLAEIRAVVGDLQHEVEWVFMGMKPDDVVCEFHQGVPIEQYPAKLASLNLDLAVVPLEVNQFNRCKSNLKLLELGACGVPVIATDLEPYRGSLPVTLVHNRPQDWVKAIRSHLVDPEALARMGDALRDTVLRDWMLEGSFLDQWAHAWGAGGTVRS